MVELTKVYGLALKDPLLEIDAEANREKIERILELIEKKKVLVLGHNYMHPLIYGLSHVKGDSLALCIAASKTDNSIILFNGVPFMGESAKIICPEKKVLVGSKEAGCSLADAIRAGDVIKLKSQFPGVPVVTYVNSYADVKAESDICCTSANALEVVLSLNSNKVIFLPDSLMGQNIQEELERKGHKVEVIYPGKRNNLKKGTCEVHDKFKLADILAIRQQYGIAKLNGDIKGKPAILVHWECLPEVLKEADFHGSTTQMSRYINENHPSKVFIATECEMAANLSAEFPKTEFIRSCSVYCRHMRKTNLDNILSALETEDAVKHEITVPENIRIRALPPIQRMLALKS